MTRFLVLLSFVVAVFAQKSLALGGIQERLGRMQKQQDFNENVDQLVGVLKTNSLKALCEAGKIASNWCRYKELLELNAAYVQQQKSVKRKSACWPGLPWPCDKRLSRAVHSGNEFDYDPKKVNDINAYNNVFKNSKDYDIPYDTDRVSDVNADEYESSDDDDKRALKCRPGLANCRGRKKGKRTLEKAPPKTKDCPQGWMYCL